MSRAPEQFDIAIVGGGLVGASLACALADLPLQVALIEAVPFGRPEQPSYDERAIAISLGTQRVYQTLGLWSQIAPAATAIRKVHISERGCFGVTRVAADDYGVEALGFNVPARAIGAALFERLDPSGTVCLFAPAKFKALTQGKESVRLALEREGQTFELNARLVVAADGARSRVRDALGMVAGIRDYEQNALVSTVSVERPHAATAYERFTPDGPIALLPLSEQRCGVVWTLPAQDAQGLRDMPDAGFLEALQQGFGSRLGRFTKVGKRLSFPLQQVVSEQLTAPRAVVVGNAANSLHPAAAQGFNLGLRDAALLAEQLALACEQGSDIGASAVLNAYAEQRRSDQARVANYTDRIVRIFSNRLPGLRTARHLGLLALDLVPPAKARIARRNMGLTTGVSRLLRGEPLHTDVR